MATHRTDTPIQHTTVATFKVWAEEFHQHLLAVGIVQHTDTGQTDFPSYAGSYPSVNTFNTYKIYRFDDSLQATAPIFFKVEFGTGSTSGRPSIRVTVGTSTNGSGTITGVVSTAFAPYCNVDIINPGTTNRVSLSAAGEGYVWIVFKANMNISLAGLGFAITRTADSAGNPSAHGFQITCSAGASNPASQSQHVLIAGPVISPSMVPNCLLPGGITSSVIGTDVQFWKHYAAQPRQRCIPYVLTTNIADTPFETERSLTVIGSTARTFISAGYTMGTTFGVNAAGSNTAMLIWE